MVMINKWGPPGENRNDSDWLELGDSGGLDCRRSAPLIVSAVRTDGSRVRRKRRRFQ